MTIENETTQKITPERKELDPAAQAKLRKEFYSDIHLDAKGQKNLEQIKHKFPSVMDELNNAPSVNPGSPEHLQAIAVAKEAAKKIVNGPQNIPSLTPEQKEAISKLADSVEEGFKGNNRSEWQANPEVGFLALEKIADSRTDVEVKKYLDGLMVDKAKKAGAASVTDLGSYLKYKLMLHNQFNGAEAAADSKQYNYAMALLSGDKNNAALAGMEYLMSSSSFFGRLVVPQPKGPPPHAKETAIRILGNTEVSFWAEMDKKRNGLFSDILPALKKNLSKEDYVAIEKFAESKFGNAGLKK